MHCKIIMILYKECCAEMAYIFDKVDLEICYKTLARQYIYYVTAINNMFVLS